MARRNPQPLPSAVAVRLELLDEPGAIATISRAVGEAGGRVRTLSTVRRAGLRRGAAVDPDDHPTVEVELEVEDADEPALVAALEPLREVLALRLTRPLGKVFGKRVIVVGGGAQVAQVALGAVTEADRHNLRGERISVDTIPLVGEDDDRLRGAGRRGPAARADARPRGVDHGRRHQPRRRGDPRRRHPDHRAQHGRLDHGARGPRGQRPRPGRDDGGDGDRRHGDVRPREAARPAD